MRYAVALLMLCSLEAQAAAKVLSGTFTQGDYFVVSWEKPTQNVDNQPITEKDMSHYEVRWFCNTGIKGIRYFEPGQTRAEFGTKNL